LCVHLLGFLLAIWNKEAFEVVGNHLGIFLHIGEDVVNGIDKWIGLMLVKIDMAKGLFKKINIEWSGKNLHTHTLDYWGLPFRHSKCKAMGHL